MNAQLREIAHDLGVFMNRYRATLPQEAMADSYALHNRLNEIAWADRLAAPSKEAGPFPERFACNGPEGTFWTDDSALANKLIAANFDRDEWTVTDTNPPGDQRQEGDVGEKYRVCRDPDCGNRGIHEQKDCQPASPPPEAAAAVGGEQLARRFHETYERLAPSFGYETRTETRQFDPTTPNGQLMIAVCSELAALASPTGVDEVRIPKPDRLDPITVYIADEGGGRGRMTIVCYNEAWTCYWGGMGNRSLREFVVGCDAQYVAGNMLSNRKHTNHERDYAERVAAAVIAALAARDGGAA